MGVLDIQLRDFKVRKGFLAQAKRAEPNRPFSKSEWDRLIGQATIMIARTPASFVFIYSIKRGIRIVPAITVLGMSKRQLFASYNRSVARFFEDHLSSFIGDPRMSVPDVKQLGQMIADWDARSVLYLSAREARR